jgi:hypothetical protein
MPQPSPYQLAKHNLGAIKMGALILPLLLFGGLSARVGLPLATLLAAGVCVLLAPIGIFAFRNKTRLERRLLRRMIDAPNAEAGRVLFAEFRFWATRRGLQLFVRSDYPRFSHQGLVRVIHDDVPNGILYDVKSHYFDEAYCAESMELEVSSDEPLAKAWDRDLRRKLLSNPNLRIEVAFDPEAERIGAPGTG